MYFGECTKGAIQYIGMQEPASQPMLAHVNLTTWWEIAGMLLLVAHDTPPPKSGKSCWMAAHRPEYDAVGLAEVQSDKRGVPSV